MRRITHFLTLATLVLAALYSWRFFSARQVVVLAQPSKTSPEKLRAVTLVFGEKDDQPTKWDGSAELSTGVIERIAGYHFSRDSSISGNSWQCSTHPWPAFSHEMWPSERPQPRATMVIPIGVTIYYQAPPGAAITVKMAGKGQFSFKPDELPEIDSIYPMRAQVDVHRSPVTELLTTDEFEDDYPSIAADGDSFWVAWQAYRDKADQIFLRRYRYGQWGERLTVTQEPGDLFGTGVTAANGKVTVVWSQHEGQDWHLKARDYDGSAFGVVEDLTSGLGKSLFHSVAGDKRGNVAVAYQSSRNGRTDIYLRTRTAGRWRPEVLISDSSRDRRANDWDAAVAMDSLGNQWVAWDGYAEGNYQVYIRKVSGGQAGPLMRVTNSTRFHAHPSIAVDRQDRVWLAWDEGPENWGKDYGFLFSGGTGLYDSRTVKIAVFSENRWQTTLRQPDSVTPYGFKRYLHTPRLVPASDGRIWLFVRPRILARHPTNLWAAGGRWDVLATYYAGDAWSPLISIPGSTARNEAEVQAAAGTNGKVIAAFVSSNQLFGGPAFGEPPGNNDVVAAYLLPAGPSENATPAAPQLASLPPEPPAGGPSEPSEKQDVTQLRGYRIEAGGKAYQIYRGDLHRHTEISLDGAGDGTLWDVYRYALDGAALDFLLVTDHQSGDSQYSWWRIEKAVDMFDVPRFFTPIYGTERSVPYPNGHRNLLFAQRGVPILDIGADERTGKVNSGSVLYPFLRKYNGIATPHSPHTSMGTDWRDSNQDLEPIVEIWEGSRTSAEHEGAFLAPSAEKSDLWAGDYRPLGFVSNAWAKGYKLGTQGSSDHASTHISYTCVISEDGTRAGLIDAMRKRHTYAATRNILLDYRLSAGGKTYLQGDELRSSSIPELTAHIVGTDRIKRVVVVRDNQYIYSPEPGAATYDLRYRDASLAPGHHYYYIRVEQEDRNAAWSSPIWVDYQPQR